MILGTDFCQLEEEEEDSNLRNWKSFMKNYTVISLMKPTMQQPT
jgi:hypothetical protein